jgi:D-alanyl-D-alanine carboxypeptidase/D-alanyl-D-alanine-endopeptidase (penicillin-binding protein 4)
MGDSLFLEKWVEAVKNLGITKINGNILPDASIFSKEGIAPKWSWEDMGNYYAAGAYGLSIYDNTYKIYFKSGAPALLPKL